MSQNAGGGAAGPVIEHAFGILEVEGEELVARLKGSRDKICGWPLGSVRMRLLTRSWTRVNGVQLNRLDGKRLQDFRCEHTEALTYLIEVVNAAPPIEVLEPQPTPARPKPYEPVISASPQSGSRSEVEVKTYKNAKEYERDAPKMAAQGWIPQGQSTGKDSVRVGRTVVQVVGTGGIGLFIGGRARREGKITVTWMRSS
jgi:hypothetical protein